MLRILTCLVVMTSHGLVIEPACSGHKLQSIHFHTNCTSRFNRSTLQAPSAAVNPYARPTNLHGLPEELILYQYEVCPFCNKVRAFLDYHKVRSASFTLGLSDSGVYMCAEHLLKEYASLEIQF